MSAATMPTSNAAISSMPLMKRSIGPCLRGRLLPPASRVATSCSLITCSATTVPDCRCGRARRPQRHCRSILALVSRLVLGEFGLELFHDCIRIAADLFHVVGPRFLERFGCFLPFGKLSGREIIDFMSLLGLYLGDAVVLEVGPGRSDLQCPFVGAVV